MQHIMATIRDQDVRTTSDQATRIPKRKRRLQTGCRGCYQLAALTVAVYCCLAGEGGGMMGVLPIITILPSAEAYVQSPLFSMRTAPVFSVASEAFQRLKKLANIKKTPKVAVSSAKKLSKLEARAKKLVAPISIYTAKEDSVVEMDDDDDSGTWLLWMRRGQRRRGSEEIKMREAAELGGVPRSDRYSSKDWFHNTITLPNSKILSEISSPCLAITSWATFLSIMYRRLSVTDPLMAQKLALPATPHSLTVSALSLLLVFKTNSAYQRFAEGRKIWESIINTSRDLYRLCILYEEELGRTKRRRLQRLLAAFPYLLRHRIRPNLVMHRLDDDQNVRDPENSILLYQDRAVNDLDPELAAVAEQEENEGSSRRRKRSLFWVDKRTLPWRLLPPDALEHCASSQNRPLWVCDRMAQELRRVPDGPNFTARERLTLISKVEKLSNSIGACERIHQTAVPLNYARHSLRALTLWLFTLPFSLVSSLQLCTGPVLFLVSWLMFGVYQIGYSIEDPFQGTLRLSVLCDTIRRDVLADEVVRNTAFELEPLQELDEGEVEVVDVEELKLQQQQQQLQQIEQHQQEFQAEQQPNLEPTPVQEKTPETQAETTTHTALKLSETIKPTEPLIVGIKNHTLDIPAPGKSGPNGFTDDLARKRP